MTSCILLSGPQFNCACCMLAHPVGWGQEASWSIVSAGLSGPIFPWVSLFVIIYLRVWTRQVKFLTIIFSICLFLYHHQAQQDVWPQHVHEWDETPLLPWFRFHIRCKKKKKEEEETNWHPKRHYSDLVASSFGWASSSTGGGTATSSAGEGWASSLVGEGRATSSVGGGRGGGSSLWLVASGLWGSGLVRGSSLVEGPAVWVQLIGAMTMGGGWGWKEVRVRLGTLEENMQSRPKPSNHPLSSPKTNKQDEDRRCVHTNTHQKCLYWTKKLPIMTNIMKLNPIGGRHRDVRDVLQSQIT